jgi:hypothetical protein
MDKLYSTLGKWDAETRDGVWHKWLWESDCNALPLEQCCDMNQMHILGILCCLDAAFEAETRPPLKIDHTLLPHTPVVHLHPNTPVAHFTLRQLLDQIECLQLNWGPVLSATSPAAAEAAEAAAADAEAVAEEAGAAAAAAPEAEADEAAIEAHSIVVALMARLGQLAQHAYAGDATLDDPQHCTQIQQDLLIISRKSLRQAVCTLFSMLRVLQILARSEPAQDPTEAECRDVVGSMRQHHVEAAGDLFSEMQQMVYLAPGMRLVYRTNFAGMYNHVSQVVYFHYPSFSRKPHFDLEQIPEEPLHMLPLIMQLIPDIPIAYDDDSHVPGIFDASGEGSAWSWLICCGAFFLVSVQERRIFSAPTLTPLVAHFLRCTGRSLSAAEDDGAATIVRKGETCAPHAHVQLM